MPRFSAHLPALGEHASRVGQRGIDVGRAGSTIGTSGLQENALGSVGASTASAHQRLTATAQRSLQQAGNGLQGPSSLLERTRSNISETETEQAQRFRGIGGEETASPTPSGTGSAQTPNAVSGWEDHTLDSGTTVYHATSSQHAYNIATNGIRPVQNNWGGGELGHGFYTHTNQDSAQNYFQGDPNDRVTLEYKTNHELNGKQKPENGTWLGDQEPSSYQPHTPFINKTEDPGEIKFHDGANQLQLQAVHWNGQRYGSYQEYEDGVEDELYYRPSDFYGQQHS